MDISKTVVHPGLSVKMWENWDLREDRLSTCSGVRPQEGVGSESGTGS